MAASRSGRYRWSSSSSKRLDPGMAEVFGRAVEDLKARREGCSDADVVAFARHPLSPIHGMFEWDDSVAGEKYRRSQAATYIRALVVVQGARRTAPVRATVRLREVKRAAGEPAQISSTELRARMLLQALAEARAWINRYRSLPELAEIIASIVRAEAKVGEQARSNLAGGRQARRS